MLRIVIFLPLLIFLFSMACMGQTFQYSRGWTNGKRAGNSASSTALNGLFHKDDDGLAEFFEVQEANDRRLERCLSQLQHLVHNPLFLHTVTNTPLTLNNPGSNGNGNSNGNSMNNNNNNNPFARSHQSNELFEELGTGGGVIIDTGNDYAKH
ncbi:hypothetical protein DOY81_005452 [Sarcophaga bullata]|nr:hypothetical protein DOY81_005452 [Sarcophaga bullata]